MARVMKDSGVEWIGKIPQEWKIARFSSLFVERKEKVSDRDFEPLSVTKLGILPQIEGVAKTDNGDCRKRVSMGDFVINSRSDRKGSSGVSAFDGSVSLINIVLHPNLNVCGGYIHHLLRSYAFQEEFYRWGHGIVADLWTTNSNDAKNILLPLPAIETQQSIADFLDARTAEIDATISKTQESIEEYKKLKQAVITQAVTKGIRPNRPMKGSGVEWIGEIPEDWKISKIKYISQFSPRCDFSKVAENDKISFSPMDNIKNGYYIANMVSYKGNLASYTAYAEGDIVIAKVTPCFENGNIAMMKNLPTPVGMGSSELFVVRAENIYAHFLFYYMRNSVFIDRGCSTMTGTGGLKRVDSDYIPNTHIPLPSMLEQQEIAAYLDEKCAAIDTLIEKKQQIITELESYKKSLIYEYVTGKKEVPQGS